MRLRRLDLTRYGRFTDAVLDFGPRGSGPDLHVVYGPNEAGKSTALSAYLDVLYGIHPQSGYAFLHDYKAMRIGAVLEDADGQPDTFVRIKANKNSLRDGADQPLGDHVLTARLGGIDRDAYRAMFSLDDDTLEAGGEDILRNEGDLGQLLFSASAGLSDLAATLDELTAEADRFYRQGRRANELGGLKRELDELAQARKTIDFQATEYRQRVRAREAAQADHEAAVAALAEARARRDEVERLRLGLARLREVRRRRADLDAFEALPEPPPGWADEVRFLREQEIGLDRDCQSLDRQINHLAQDLAAIPVDEAVLAAADRIAALLGEPKSRFETADLDLPRVRDEARDLDARIAERLRRLEQSPESNPATLILPAATVRTLRDLIARRSGVVGQHDSALAEQRAAEERLAAAQATLARISGAPDADPDRETEAASAWHVLDSAVRASSRDDSETRLRMEIRGRAALADALDAAMSALAPWGGDTAALAGLAVPDASRLAAWRAALMEAGDDLKGATREAARLDGDRARLDAQIKALRASGGVVDDAAAAVLRTARNEAWRAHRAALDEATATAFEDALRADDGATDSRLAHTADLARLRQMAVETAALESDLQLARARLDTARDAFDAGARAVSGALTALGLPEDWSVDSLTDWLERRRAALEADAALREADRRIAAAREDAEQSRETLRAALVGAGVPVAADTDAAALREAAEAALQARANRRSRLEAAQASVQEAGRAVEDRARTLREKAQAEADWRAGWQAALAGTWLAETDHVAIPEAVGGVLDDLAALEGWLSERANLARRIEGMRRDQATYIEALTGVLTDLGEAAVPPQPLQAAAALGARLGAARLAAEKRTDRAAALEKAKEDRAALDAPLATLAQRRDDMGALFGVETLAEVAAALEQVEERARRRDRLAEAETALAETMRQADPAAAEAALASLDVEALDQEAADLESRFGDLEEHRDACRDALTRARDALAGLDGDDAVARLEAHRRTVLLDIEARVRRHLRLRLGIVAAQRALAVYRERHRSAMLARAAEAFATISRGAYTGLGTQPGDGGDRLVALEPGGGSKTVDGLSKGTRFQLYLALRVAGYHEIARHAEPVPFIADDIMETFDDFRAEEAMRLFADMADVGQVIYMTHHRHLVETARAICPTVRIHTLNGAIPPS